MTCCARHIPARRPHSPEAGIYSRRAPRPSPWQVPRRARSTSDSRQPELLALPAFSRFERPAVPRAQHCSLRAPGSGGGRSPSPGAPDAGAGLCVGVARRHPPAWRGRRHPPRQRQQRRRQRRQRQQRPDAGIRAARRRSDGAARDPRRLWARAVAQSPRSRRATRGDGRLVGVLPARGQRGRCADDLMLRTGRAAGCL